MSWGLYITHPEVEIDPNVPVDRWGLSETGRQRANTFARRNLLPKSAPIFSSTETKAQELAQILSSVTGSKVKDDPDLGENDRSATGFLEPAEFESYVKQLFTHPEKSVAGWETARNAQKRIVATMENILARHDASQPLILAGHGCVGTLLKCHYGGREIKQSEDQRQLAHPGGGNVFVFDPLHRKLLCDWATMEDWNGI